jgi:hypothetical protein
MESGLGTQSIEDAAVEYLSQIDNDFDVPVFWQISAI